MPIRDFTRSYEKQTLVSIAMKEKRKENIVQQLRKIPSNIHDVEESQLGYRHVALVAGEPKSEILGWDENSQGYIVPVPQCPL